MIPTMSMKFYVATNRGSNSFLRNVELKKDKRSVDR